MTDDMFRVFILLAREQTNAYVVLARFSCTIASEIDFHRNNTLSRLVPPIEVRAAKSAAVGVLKLNIYTRSTVWYHEQTDVHRL